MKQRVSVITLPVSDLAVSRAFYCDGLGWTPVFDDGDVIFFQFNGFVLALWTRSSFEKDIQAPSTGHGHAFALGHNVGSREEADRVMALAASLRAPILKPATPTSWGGYSGCFADPDGHVWEIAHNPGWQISEEGYVSMRP
jgi:catechol 2,3-dioxygenase-like lactoylglutathione lyase family enzyme